MEIWIVNAILYIAAVVAVISTLMVITGRNAVHALLYLIVSLLSVALIFFILGAPFVAALEVIIYAGAIMVLFVFVIMMLNLGPESTETERQWLTPGIWVGPAILRSRPCRGAGLCAQPRSDQAFRHAGRYSEAGGHLPAGTLSDGS